MKSISPWPRSTASQRRSNSGSAHFFARASASTAMPDLAPHQREAVNRALALIARHGGAILADDVGLGKSYVAARVAAELQSCGSCVEIVVPASLVSQWRDTLCDFGIDAKIIT